MADYRDTDFNFATGSSNSSINQGNKLGSSGNQLKNMDSSRILGAEIIDTKKDHKRRCFEKLVVRTERTTTKENVEDVKCSLQVEVIDDTALIEATVAVSGFKNCSYKNEIDNGYRKKGVAIGGLKKIKQENDVKKRRNKVSKKVGKSCSTKCVNEIKSNGQVFDDPRGAGKKILEGKGSKMSRKMYGKVKVVYQRKDTTTTKDLKIVENQNVPINIINNGSFQESEMVNLKSSNGNKQESKIINGSFPESEMVNLKTSNGNELESKIVNGSFPESETVNLKASNGNEQESKIINGSFPESEMVNLKTSNHSNGNEQESKIVNGSFPESEMVNLKASNGDEQESKIINGSLQESEMVNLKASNGNEQESTIESVETPTVNQTDDGLNPKFDDHTEKTEEKDQDVSETTTIGSKKMAYSRDVIEALRFVGGEEQSQKWNEVYSGLSPTVAKEYTSLIVDTDNRQPQRYNNRVANCGSNRHAILSMPPVLPLCSSSNDRKYAPYGRGYRVNFH